MECPYCGTINPAPEKFCQLCTRRIDDKEGEAFSAFENEEPAEKLASSSWRISVALAAVLFLILGGGSWLLFNQNKVNGAPGKVGAKALPVLRPGTPPPMQINSPPLWVVNAARRDLYSSVPEAPGTASPSTASELSSVEPQHATKPAEPKLASKKDELLKQRPGLATAKSVALDSATPPPASMAAEMQTCEGKNFFAKGLCQEKARWKYCEGKWGKTAECPKPRDPSDGGG